MNLHPGHSLELLSRAAGSIGLDASGAVVIREGAHGIYRLPGGVVARIGKPGTSDIAFHELRVSRWLNRSGIPTVRAVASVDQPVVIDDRPVTFWHQIPQHRTATPAELGTTLRTLHTLPPPPDFELPSYQPLANVKDRLANSGDIPTSDREWLVDYYQHLEQLHSKLPKPVQSSVIHGDAWQGNLVVPADGIPVLLDLDKVSLGPPEWDLVPMAVDYTDYTRLTSADYRAFVAAYGSRDVTSDADYRVYAEVQELRWVAFALTMTTRNHAARHEIGHRIDCLQGLVPKPWTWRAL